MTNHTIIIGPGRCGTSLLLKLLTLLGVDSGYSKEEVTRDLGRKGSGFEWPIRGVKAANIWNQQPYLIKNPGLSNDLEERIKRWNWKIDHAYILIRDPEQIVKSRFNRTRGDWRKASKDDCENYLQRIYKRTSNALFSVEKLEIPYTIINYPKYAIDTTYAWDKLCFIIKKYNISFDAFEKVWVEGVDPKRIVRR